MQTHVIEYNALQFFSQLQNKKLIMSLVNSGATTAIPNVKPLKQSSSNVKTVRLMTVKWIVLGVSLVLSILGVGVAIFALLQNKVTSVTTSETLSGKTIDNLVVYSDLWVDNTITTQDATMNGSLITQTQTNGAKLIAVDQVQVLDETLTSSHVANVLDNSQYVQCSLTIPVDFTFPATEGFELNMASLFNDGAMQYRGGEPSFFSTQLNETLGTASFLTLPKGIWAVQVKLKLSLPTTFLENYLTIFQLRAYDPNLTFGTTSTTSATQNIAQMTITDKDQTEFRLSSVLQLPTSFGFNADLIANQIGCGIFFQFSKLTSVQPAQIEKLVFSAARLL